MKLLALREDLSDRNARLSLCKIAPFVANPLRSRLAHPRASAGFAGHRPPPAKQHQHVALGRAIRHLRGRLGISQDERGGASFARTYMGGFERGVRNVSFGKVLTIRTGLEVSLQELIAECERQLEA